MIYKLTRTNTGHSNPIRNLEINAFKIALLNFLTLISIESRM